MYKNVHFAHTHLPVQSQRETHTFKSVLSSTVIKSALEIVCLGSDPSTAI